MRRMIALSAGVLALILLSAGVTLAGGPTRDPSTVAPGFFFDLDGVCDFPVRLTILVNREYTLTFPTNANGVTRQLVNGKLVVLITNLDSSASVTRDISGPGEYLYEGEIGLAPFTLSAQGAWALWFAPDQLGPGTPGTFFINRGLFVFRTEADSSSSILKQSGTQEDLCAVLGS